MLSTADLCVLALTYALEQKEVKEEEAKDAEKVCLKCLCLLLCVPNEPLVGQVDHEPVAEQPTAVESEPQPAQPEDELEQAVSKLDINENDDGDDIPTDETAEDDQEEQEPLDVQVERIPDETTQESSHTSPSHPSSPPQPKPQPTQTEDEPLYDDPSSDDDDGEGEWITPSNVGLHKSRALNLLPDDASAAKKATPAKQIKAGCMTADFAMQNVLLQMGLSLVGVEGKRIERVKTWVLRCHACFKYVPIPSSPTSDYNGQRSTQDM